MNECCELETNRREGFGPRGPMSEDQSPEGVSYCIVCQARHVEIDAEPVKLGVRVEPL